MNYNFGAKIKWEFKVIQFEDGTFASFMPDNMTTVDKINLIMASRSQSLSRLNDLAEQLLRDMRLSENW